ncbi:hypothetical protein BTA51_03375 [Hahella sp. CCB-MM4]|uniref:protein kinase domain-containing protein n=1 Tax=Hahella sp. (strain CCB-MM4) TaxID=1926491 RepID=UPI000BD71AED|nr:protein kinase [Hahella sp. CCB-MM4]OZG75428.1 hypothetical protein BTA51_03375 [Hahella sp. CCB-MM4]
MTEQGNHFLTSGTRIAEYRIEKLLGEGGFGLTYLAFDENLEKQVAIKEYLPIDFAIRSTDATVHPRTESTKEAFEWGLNAFINEARTLARFQNPYIVQVYRYFDMNGTAYIVMEYIEGLTLRKSIRESGKLDQSQLMPILLPILEGLVDVHKAEILHRDIKPENILIRDNGKPVLIDFGAARQALGAKSRSITTIITPGYAPIEQYSSKAKVGPWSDIYALGAVAYFCLTQIKPEDASDRVVDDQLRPLTDIARQQGSPAFLEAIDKALAVTPGDRPQTLDEWTNMLQAGEGWKAPTAKDQLLAKKSQEQTKKAGPDATRAMPSNDPEATQLAGSDQAATLARLSTGTGPRPKDPPKRSPVLIGMVLFLAVVAASIAGIVVFKPEILPLWAQNLGMTDASGKLEGGNLENGALENGNLENGKSGTGTSVPESKLSYPLYVTTEPPNASISISGGQQDYTSGIKLPAGEYKLHISLQGYKTIDASVRVVDQEVRKHFVMERAISREEQQAYDRAAKGRQVEDLQAYIDGFPDGAYIGQVKTWLEQVHQEIAAREERARLEKIEQERLAKLEQEKRAKLEQERLAKLEQEKRAKLEQERLARLEQEKRAKLEQEQRAKLEQERRAKEAEQVWVECKPMPSRAAALTGRVYIDTGNTGSNFTLKLGRFTVQPNAIRKIGASDPYRSLCATSSCYEIRGSFGKQEYTYMTGGAVTSRGEACFYYFEEKPHVIRIP